MLNENDDLGWLPAETAAAMRDLARTVTDAPPLRLTAEAAGLSPARPRRPPRGPRFRWSWGAPLLAAVTVVALAVALVTVKNLPDQQMTPSATASSQTSAPGTNGDAVPEYYVALQPASSRPGAPNGLIVGDTVTGRTVTIVAPPAGTTIVSVSGAADDRTFAVAAAPTSGGPGLDIGFYLLTITPGGTPAAKLAQLPMEPLPGVIATALSASGKELAVATANEHVTGGPVVKELAVYSVATGRPMVSWSTADTAAIVADTKPGFTLGRYTDQYPALSWIHGDQQIAFPELGGAGGAATSVISIEVRTVDFYPAKGGAASTATGGDLIADSRVIRNYAAASLVRCGPFPVLSGNGTTMFCAFASGPDGHTSPGTVRQELRWLPGATSLANDQQWRSFVYIKEVGVPMGSAVSPVTVWSNSTGTRLLIEWSVVTPGKGGTSDHVTSAHFGELALGQDSWAFTPLPVPAIFAAGGAPSIAW